MTPGGDDADVTVQKFKMIAEMSGKRHESESMTNVTRVQRRSGGVGGDGG